MVQHAFLVDNSPLMRRILMKAIHDYAPELEPVSAQTAHAALSLITVIQPAIVFVAGTLPDMPGEDVVARLREAGCAAPIIALVGFCDEERYRNLVGAGAGYVLQKPFSFFDIQEALQLATGREPHLRILMVDDSHAQRRVVAATLDAIDMEIQWEEARDGPEGLRVFLSRHFDLVMLDLNLPRLSGADVMQEMRAARPGVHVAILTADPESRLAQSAREAGADAVLSKPVAPPDLVGYVLSALAKQNAAGKYRAAR